MPTYVVLVNFTDQGIRSVKQTTERNDHGGEIAEKHGMKLEQAYWTVGPYDMVAVFEAPDDEAVSAHLLEIGSLGNIRTTTLRAYDERDFRDTYFPLSSVNKGLDQGHQASPEGIMCAAKGKRRKGTRPCHLLRRLVKGSSRLEGSARGTA
jgi:uncharacterized protein with GYD domain